MIRLERLHIWLLVALLYFTQGIPLGLAMEALPAILRQQGTSLSDLAFLPLVGLPWVVKFLWAPVVDNHWRAATGRRRSWIIPMQGTAALCLLAILFTGISGATTGWIIGLAALGSLASATQDIATDGLTAETFSGAALAHANALQIGGTMAGFFFGGSGCLILTGLLGQQFAMTVILFPFCASLVLALWWREPTLIPRDTLPAASLGGFFRRPGALLLTGGAFLSAITAASGYGLAKLLLVDAGWSLDRVGQLGMLGGIFTVFLGAGGGSWLVARLGAPRMFAAGICLSGVAGLIWTRLAAGGPGFAEWQAVAAMASGCMGAGLASVAMMTMAMNFARRSHQAGTDMTAVQSARDLGEISTSSSMMAIAAQLGYGFTLAAGTSLAFATLFACLGLRHTLTLAGNAPADSAQG